MRHLELKVGTLIVVSGGLLAMFIAILGGFSFGPTSRIYVDYDFSGNIHEGAPVKISGIKVGKVEKIEFFGGELDPQVNRRVQVRLTVQIEERARKAIHDDAEFFVNTQGVLGEQYLEIAPGRHENTQLPPGSKVKGVDPPRSDLIIARLYEFLDAVTRLLQEDKESLRDLLRSAAKVARSLDKLLGENEAEVKKLLTDLDRLTAETAELVAKLDKGVGTGEELHKTLANIESISTELKTELAPLLQKTKRALDGVGDVAQLLGPEEKKKLQRSLDDLLVLSGKVSQVAGDAQSLLSDVRRGKGTVGALIVDQQIYDDLKELTRDLKRNPWKFFWKE
ncbi:MAG TPA: MlaD family protein [Pseudomonadota bacterium]|jgi:phospholipid/cholesterol/gamma-HCH transport system substrate-binding protein|nr:MlaD family protein [Pseudomonadota bacterium]HND09469.1 MlaD family protein [Pseudomonadota bacterium]HNI59089.1 MlaD family protein [Pseudomonadota bacterium]HNK46918.1 MlaD family protein [Pseudomonadota bacterium]HNN52039.1 MlaD family protein [Pseudomonadota bacterium]